MGSPEVAHVARWVGNEGVDTLVARHPSTPARYKAFTLEIVGTVSHRDFAMQPHGNWSTALPHKYSDHAGSFTLQGHGSQTIALTWNSVLSSIKQLQGGSPDGIITAQDTIVFTHRLFRVRLKDFERTSIY